MLMEKLKSNNFDANLYANNQRVFKLLRFELRLMVSLTGCPNFCEAQNVFLETRGKLRNLSDFDRRQYNKLMGAFRKLSAENHGKDTAKAQLPTNATAVNAVTLTANTTIATNSRLTHEISQNRADIRQTQKHTLKIRTAQGAMRNNIAKRIQAYPKNTVGSRGGHGVEVFYAEAFNIDAVIK